MTPYRQHATIVVLISVVISATLTERPYAHVIPDCTRDARWQFVNKSLEAYCTITWSNHVFHASSRAPLAQSLPRAAAKDVTFFAQHMADVSALALRKRAAESLPNHCHTPYDLAAETEAQQSWLSSTTQYVASLDLPPLRSHCLTRVLHAPTRARITVARLRTFTAHLSRAARRLSAFARSGSGELERMLASWPAIVGDMSASFLDDVYSCHAWGTVGVRARGHWGVNVRMTNAGVYTTMSEGGRHYLREIIGLNRRGRIGAMHVAAWREGGQRENATTTTIARWSGRPQVSEFFQLPVRDTPALKELLIDRRKERSLARETVFSSNVAILILPLFMTLVPMSAVDFVDKPLLVLYAIITDVFSTLPLLIKGIELLVLPDVEGCESWVHGVEAEDVQSTVIIETWCASCAARSSFRTYGYAFVGSALFFMIFGLSTEWVIRRQVELRMKKGNVLPRRFWSWKAIRKYAKGDESSSSSSRTSSFGACSECSCSELSDIPEIYPDRFDPSRRFLRSGNFWKGSFDGS